ncbi:MAG: hypothetical protein LKK01_05130 [Prevotella sp.]|nr:hypothetical protein [Prevotella sp.]
MMVNWYIEEDEINANPTLSTEQNEAYQSYQANTNKGERTQDHPLVRSPLL